MQPPELPAYGQPMQERHAILGIISFVMSVLVGLALFVLFVIAGIIGLQSQGQVDAESPQMILLGLGFILMMGLALLSGVLGTVSCFMAGKKLFGILGATFGGLIFLSVCMLMVIGMLMG